MELSCSDVVYITTGEELDTSSTVEVQPSNVLYVIQEGPPIQVEKSIQDTELIQLSVENGCVSNVVVKNDSAAATAATNLLQGDRKNDDVPITPPKQQPRKHHQCTSCHTIFTTEAHLQRHSKRKCLRDSAGVEEAELTDGVKVKKKKHVCSYCDSSFILPYLLKRHMQKHSGERPFKCEKCDKTFLTKAHLKRHNVVHKSQDEAEHACDECNKVFAWPSELQSHLDTHHHNNNKEPEAKRYKCGICGRTFLHANSLTSHTVNKHTVNGNFTCVVCKHTTQKAPDLIQHMKTHSVCESVKCARCESLFTSLSDLETHVCTNFGGKPLVCAKCEVEFCTTEAYCDTAVHRCLRLGDNRLCGSCGKRLKSVWHLREHLITHTGEKPFHCSVCKKSFRRKRELQIHITQHSDDKCFACSLCSSTFSDDTYLKQHMRTKHREKKFACEVCGHMFAYQSVLTNHLAFHKRTGNKKFGKRNHRNGDLVRELRVNSSVNSEEPSGEGHRHDSLLDQSPTDNFIVNSDGSVAVDETIGRQEETLSSDNSAPHLHNIEAQPDGSGGTVPGQLIEPRIELHKAELDSSIPTAIYQTNSDMSTIIRCATCFQPFSSQTSLLRHRKDAHQDGKPFQCNYCSRTFSVAANVRQHESIHQIKRKFSCSECGRSFKVTHKLRDHLKSKHNMSTDQHTDLELNLKYGVSFTNDDVSQDKSPDISTSMLPTQSNTVTNSSVADFSISDELNAEKIALLAQSQFTQDINVEDLALLGNLQEKSVETSVLEGFGVSGVADGIILLQTSENVGNTVDVGELCESENVSFIVDISKFMGSSINSG